MQIIPNQKDYSCSLHFKKYIWWLECKNLKQVVANVQFKWWIGGSHKALEQNKRLNYGMQFASPIQIHRRKNRFRPPEIIEVFDTRQLHTAHRWQPCSLPVPCSRALSSLHRVSPSLPWPLQPGDFLQYSHHVIQIHLFFLLNRLICPCLFTLSVQRFRTKMLSSVTQTERTIVVCNSQRFFKIELRL